MSKEILEQLFDSLIKVRLLKFFLRNPDGYFSLRDIARRIKSDRSSCQRQLRKLENIKLIHSRFQSGRKNYSVNSSFDFYNELKTLVLKSSPASKQKMLKQLRSLGKINLVVLSGVFIDADNSRVDLLLVGDGLKKQKLSNFLRDLEAEVGREIDYVVMTTEEFKYRHNMFDRFIRDVLEKPHEKLINRIKLH